MKNQVLNYLKKGSLLTSFFLLSKNAFSLQIEKETLDRLAQTEDWHALLQLSSGRPIIRDKQFILSLDSFTPRREMQATLDIIKNKKTHLCRFPARRLWLIKNIPQLKNTHWPINHCTEYKEYQNKAPANNISVIYTSKNLYSPSSMMGHIMLKIEGFNSKNKKVEHGVSFFTEVKGVNIPKIIWDNVVTGKKGYFQVAPYAPTQRHYRQKEQRNIWEYQLKLTDFQKKIIHNYLWELKEIDITYFFHKYNCATLTNNIISVAFPNLPKSKAKWITPIDVAKRINKYKLVEKTLINPAENWKVKSFSSHFSDKKLESIKKWITSSNKATFPQFKSSEDQFIGLELANSYNNFLYQKGKITKQFRQHNENLLKSFYSKEQQKYFIDLSLYKSPLKAPSDSQIALSIGQHTDQNQLHISFLPASHRLEDDNREFHSETALELSSITASLYRDQQDLKLRLESWKLYSVSSLLPRDKLTKGTSGNFSMSIERQFDKNFNRRLVTNMSGGLGVTKSLNHSSGIYSMLNVGLAANLNQSYAFISPEIGFYSYLNSALKTKLSLKQQMQTKDKTEVTTATFKGIYYVSPKYSLTIDAQAHKIRNQRKNSVFFGVKHLF